MASRAAPFKLLLISVAAASCGAPPSERATGAVAEDVTASLESGAQAFEHGAWDRLLAEGTRDGLVDYRYFQLHLMELDAYLATLAEVDAASLAPSHLEAVLINAYNALTIRSILSHPGVGSIRGSSGLATGAVICGAGRSGSGCGSGPGHLQNATPITPAMAASPRSMPHSRRPMGSVPRIGAAQGRCMASR